MPIRVLLVDDHAVVRDGVRLILEAQADIEVVGATGSGLEAVALAGRLRPDVVVMDVSLPDVSGIDATRRLAEAIPDVQVVILSMRVTSEFVHQAFKAGARAYVAKESAGHSVVAAVRAAKAGRRHLCPIVSEVVLERFVEGGEPAAARSPLERLSPREREVLQLVVAGKRSAEIGKLLFLSAKTVETYRSRLMAKLGVHDLPSLVKLAVEHGLISTS